MKKILLVGVRPDFGKSVKILLKSLSEDKVRFVEAYFLADTEDEAIRIAEANRGINLVFFMGYLTIPGQLGSLHKNIEVADELPHILGKDLIMVAATEHTHTDEELLNHGCTIVLTKEKIPQWLQKNLC